MSSHYVVTWEMDIDAETPQDAARQAWAAMRAPESTANVFDVLDETGGCTRVDLEEEPGQVIQSTAYRAAARRLYHEEGECEIDDAAEVSISDSGGAYVQAWVWVSDEDLTGE